jgi:hypothetical protein
MNRESIYAALFALVSAVPGINTRSRRLKMWTDVAPADQPALFMAQVGEAAETLTTLPTRWHLHVELYLYAHTQDSAQSPASVLNPLVDAIVALIMPPNQEKQTLGGLAHYCRVSGQIKTDEGVLGDQAVAIIPVEVFAV